jgi:hypothetical protein
MRGLNQNFNKRYFKTGNVKITRNVLVKEAFEMLDPARTKQLLVLEDTLTSKWHDFLSHCF